MQILLDPEFEYLLEKKMWLSNGYPEVWLDGKTIKVHKIVLPNTDKSLETDHINRNKLDNRRANLRLVNHRINMQNRDVFSQSGFKGVYLDKSSTRLKPWKAQVRGNDGKKVHLGYFTTAEEAGAATRDFLVKREAAL